MPSISGDGTNNSLTGGPDADVLSGGLGNDSLVGGAGNDTLYGFGSDDQSPSSGAVNVHQIPVVLDTPVQATFAPGQAGQLYVVEITGQIQIVNLATEQKNATPFLAIPSTQIGSGGERGLLGVAFSPNYANDGQVYITMAAPTGEFQVWRYTRSAGNPNQVDPSSKSLILSVAHPNNQHYAGWLGFGQDGDLYVTTGDNDVGPVAGNPAQDMSSLLGKLLRIDVTSGIDDFPNDPNRNYHIPSTNPFVNGGGAPEIFASGLRNPWRASFDSHGNLYIADVGENAAEEVDIIPAGSPGGQNFGWPIREANIGPATAGLTDPNLVYDHGSGAYQGDCIIGGPVYAGPGGAQGLYFMGDFVDNNLWAVQFVNGQPITIENIDNSLVYDGSTHIDTLTSLGTDASGQLYATTVDGNLFRLTPTTAAGDGDDMLRGGDGDDQLFGGAGNDTLAGGTGSNVLSGGLGDDRLIGGAGQDQMTGGAGADVFAFPVLPSGPAHITDFQLGVDGLDFSLLFAAQGYHGSDPVSDGHILLQADGSGGTLVMFDADGSGPGAPVAVADLAGVSPNGLTWSALSGPAGQAPADFAATAIQTVLREAPSASPALLQVETSFVSDQTEAAQLASQIVALAANTSSVATLAYQFFTGSVPTAGGMDFLVSPTGPNPNNLNSTYYQDFNIENRYINFSVNLGSGQGQGAADFSQAYSAGDIYQAVHQAYRLIFGVDPTDAKVHTIVDSPVTADGMTRGQYFAYYGGDGLNGIGTKAAMVGWLLTEAVKADVGDYARSNDAFLTDVVLNSAPFGVNLIAHYDQQGFAYTGG